jgi:hypothetical protein
MAVQAIKIQTGNTILVQRTGRHIRVCLGVTKEASMKKFAVLAAMLVIAVAALTAPTTARAGNGGAVAAGIAGGFIGGLALGSALAPRPYYYYEPVPVHCYWTRGRRYWDAWRGVWVHPRIRVCK